MTSTMKRNGTLARSLFAALLLAGAVMSLSACNTVNGAGKDLSNAGTATGSAVSTTATTVQQKL